MNDEQHESLSSYLRDLADALLLRDWEITLERGWSDSDAYATISVWAEENHANVKVCEGFFGHPASERRETLTHELLHLHINPIKHALQNARSNLGEHTYGVVEGMMDDATEFAVDGIARVLAAYLPLPPQEKTNV